MARIGAGLRSSLRSRPLEQVLPAIGAELTVVHAESDPLGTAAWASTSAADACCSRPAPHSWPYRDTTAFADLVDRLAP